MVSLRLTRLLVAASRSVTLPGVAPGGSWEEAVATALDRLVAEVGGLVRTASAGSER